MYFKTCGSLDKMFRTKESSLNKGDVIDSLVSYCQTTVISVSQIGYTLHGAAYVLSWIVPVIVFLAFV